MSCSFEIFFACCNPHRCCGLFDFEVLCSVMCSFSELIKKKNVAQSERPLPQCSSANKLVWNGCQIWNGSLSLQNSPGVLTAQFQLVFMLYSENIPVNLIWLSTSHFLHCSFGESFANASEVKRIVQPFTRPYVVPKLHAVFQGTQKEIFHKLLYM